MATTELGFEYPPNLDASNDPPKDIKALADSVNTYLKSTGLVAVAYTAEWGDGIGGGEVSEYERVNGEVTIYLAALCRNPQGHAAGAVVLTMPPGFRPRRRIRGTGNNAGTGRGFSINAAGQLYMDAAQSSSGLSAFVGSITYPAALA